MYGGLEPQCSGSYPRIFGSSSWFKRLLIVKNGVWFLTNNCTYRGRTVNTVRLYDTTVVFFKK